MFFQPGELFASNEYFTYSNTSNSVKPIHYDISLYDLELGGSFTFKGIVDIEVKVQEATKEIVINSNELKIHKTTILSNNSCQKPYKLFDSCV